MIFLNVIFKVGGLGASITDNESPIAELKSAETYDVMTLKHVQIADMNVCRVGCRAVAVRKKIYVIGGEDRNSKLSF